MRFSTVTAAIASASLASARIIGISTPTTISASQPFDLTIVTENYIQSVQDISVAWGYSTAPYPLSLDYYPSSAYLGPNKSNIAENITIPAVGPAQFNTSEWIGKEVTLIAAVTSLYGASNNVITTGFSVNVTIGGDCTSETVESDGQAWTSSCN